MPTQEQLETAQATLEAKRKIEEIVGSPVGTVKTYSAPTDEEFEKMYETMYEKKSKLLKSMKKYRPLGLLSGILVILVGIALTVICIIYDMEILPYVILFLGVVIGGGILVAFCPKSWNPPSKEEYFDEISVENAKKWLDEAKKNNYYFDLLEKALAGKNAYATTLKSPHWLLAVGDTEFTVIRRDERLIVAVSSFQIEDVSGIAIQKRVQEKSVSVSTENKLYNKYNGSTLGNKFTTETDVTRSTEYLVSFSFSNRINPYSVYVGTDSNLLLSLVNIFERITGLQAQYI